MSSQLILDDTDPDAPCRGDWVAHVGPDDEENGLWSKVLTLEASDRSSGVYEVLDDVKVRMFVTWHEEHWLQVHLRD